ncbi:putative transcriptional regulator [Sodalis glossinidius str. 'morsitans']|uniref:Transcriptional regulator n=3 Tax=Sodalis glossinidius TaxID=63612 RepID=Q2NRQ3_SODGM|nr:putative transcriptional regulator [Sodalis glossinidius str. 'morsitans']
MQMQRACLGKEPFLYSHHGQKFRKQRRGWPRQFDTEQALDRAMQMFRNKGYHAASVADLAADMGLTVGSIYKAFRDKQTLFLQVFELYLCKRRQETRQALAQAVTCRDKVAVLLQDYAALSQGVEGIRGCLVADSATQLCALEEALARLVRQALDANQTRITAFIRTGQEDGSVDPGLNAEHTALLMLALLQGMRVVGKAGRQREEMMAVAALVLRLLDRHAAAAATTAFCSE